MSSISLTPVHLFGVKADVANNVHYVDEHTIAYVCGANVVLAHTENHSQRFVSLGDTNNVATAVALSPTKRYMAVALRGDTPSVAVIDVQAHKIRKVDFPAL
jgi:cilia- and flagella-associated protein 57